MKFYDRATFSTRVMTDAGFMEATARVGRPGVQDYAKGIDFNDSDLPENLKAKPFGTVIKVLRPATEVFNPHSMKSFESVPVTNNHPPTMVVDSTNVKDYQVGFSRKVEAGKDGEAVEAVLLVQDQAAIKNIMAGKDQVSLGYDAQIDFTSGVDDIHGAYDATMSDIRGNHIAIVDRARAGADFRLNDQLKKESDMKTRVMDGKSFELSDDAANCFDALIAEKSVTTTKITELQTRVNDAATELETVKGERDAAKAKTLNDSDVNEQVSKLVKARIELVDAAGKVVTDVDFAGKSDKEIRLEVIKKLSDGKMTIADNATDDYINAVYATLVATAKPKSKALGDGLGGDPTTVNDADSAREAMVAARAGK